MTLTEFYSEPENFAYVNQATDATDKQKRISELRKKYEQSNFDFDEHNKAAKAHFGLSDVKNIIAKHSVKDSIKQYILQRRSTIAANKKKKAEAEKLRRNGWQST